MMSNEQHKAYRDGWDCRGEWKCPHCGTMIGKNLLNQRPFLLAAEHVKKCEKIR
jgi:hypothetical protein